MDLHNSNLCNKTAEAYRRLLRIESSTCNKSFVRFRSRPSGLHTKKTETGAMFQVSRSTPKEGPHYRVESCSVEDGSDIASAYITAMWTDPSWPLIWRPKSREYVTSQCALRMPFLLLTDPVHRRHQKAVACKTGEVVGYARWLLPDLDSTTSKNSWPEAKVPHVDEERGRKLEEDFTSADYEFDHSWDEIDESMLHRKDQLMQGKPYMLLDVLAVQPTHRGQGVASALVQSGLDVARELGLDVFIHALKAAVGVYKRAGFRLLDAITEDDSKYGGNGEYGAYFLEWKANPDPDAGGHRGSS